MPFPPVTNYAVNYIAVLDGLDDTSARFVIAPGVIGDPDSGALAVTLPRAHWEGSMGRPSAVEIRVTPDPRSTP